MSDLNFIELLGAWPSTSVTLAEFGQKTEYYLKDLRDTCPELFEGLRIMADTVEESVPLPVDLDGFGAVIQHWGWDRGAHWVFEPTNEEDESPLPESTNSLGYQIQFDAEGNEIGKGSKILVIAGRTGLSSDAVWIRFPTGIGEENLALARRALEVTFRHWPLAHGAVLNSDLGNAQLDADQTRPMPRALSVGLLTWLRAPGVIEALPPGVHAEAWGPPGGILITLDGDLGPRSTPGQIEQANSLRDTLYERGFLLMPRKPPIGAAALKQLKLRERRRP